MGNMENDMKEDMEEDIEKIREDVTIEIKENVMIIMERECKYDSSGRKIGMCRL